MMSINISRGNLLKGPWVCAVSPTTFSSSHVSVIGLFTTCAWISHTFNYSCQGFSKRCLTVCVRVCELILYE